MIKDSFHDLYVANIMESIQELEELSGPDDIQGYILILQEVKRNIQKRIDVAESQCQY
jgi:hypothetical protein